ncbi:MAG TPA: dihydroorotate dehydrogenase electron transfer subunit [bacterium]|nr:dihydroorotate dehydrogenase electron transfer subunit [bacterium]HOL34688.1 dihydroorotate dehydrogenase electron transfer subunit [bacterium]HPP07554.1 dihydroorotate dehydrogenase electron transfer subunit [bacterium]
MKHKKVRVLSKKIFNGKYVELFFENRFDSIPQPGQFVHIFTGGAFMRRPLSIAGYSPEKIRIVFQIKGPGTKKLAELSNGTKIDILGPLGNSFPGIEKQQKIYLVAGGIGIAPILFVADKFIQSGNDFKILYGARTKNDLLDFLLPEGNYKKIISTDDGSAGEKATVIEILTKEILKEKPDIIFSAGPFAMLKSLGLLCAKENIDAYVSLENVMFCGLGVCQGCVVETTLGYQRVCKDGPVFHNRLIKWK